jgi:NAD(P)-dependent dehydrogenase (short-subunit alcohol dehydrogenase family)
VSGILGQYGQTNYGAAKAGIAAMTVIAQLDMDRCGLRVNCIAPSARTWLTGNTPASSDGFDALDPANIAPFVVCLASPRFSMKGKVNFVHEARFSWAARGTSQGLSSRKAAGRWTNCLQRRQASGRNRRGAAHARLSGLGGRRMCLSLVVLRGTTRV